MLDGIASIAGVNYETTNLQFAVMFLFLLKILYRHPRIDVFVEIVYLRI
jgi:hypothetical protein